jgi:hypothetical protein
VKKPVKDMPFMSAFTQIMNEKKDGECNFEWSDGEYAEIRGTYTSEELTIISEAMDELAAAKEAKAYAEYLRLSSLDK